MTLKYGILGILFDKKLTGYEIDKILKGSLNNFWYTNQSQIYLEIKKLEKENFVVSEIQKVSETKSKRVLTITNLGKTKLREWLLNNHDISGVVKLGFLVKLFILSTLTDEEVIVFLKKCILWYEGRLVSLQEIKKQIDFAKTQLKDHTDLRTLFFKEKTNQLGIDMMKFCIDEIHKIMKEVKDKKWK